MRRMLLVTIAALIPVGVFAAQSMIIDKDLDYQSTTGRIFVTVSGPLDWRTGDLYRRLEITEKPTDREIAIQICVWSGGEGCSPCDCFTSTGVLYRKYNWGEWWKNGSGPQAMTSHGDRAYPIKSSCCGGKWLSTQVASWCEGPSVAGDLPVKGHVTEYYVPAGESFDCPDDWTDAPWEGCGATETRDRRKNSGIGAGMTAQLLSDGFVKVTAPGAREVSLFTIHGKLIASRQCDAAGASILCTRSISASMVLVRADSLDGVVTRKIALRD
ncbi:MAG: hypothetical protein GF418_12390 [Chitinivibrionales bacterium]|nr:hypothetical protein [Chitinivibrionales bacterium]MBD3396418.1 hypothetical protein [Chitinivibrionales bacterium]